MIRTFVAIPLEPVLFGDPETGVWCPHCLLPSAYTQRVVLLQPCPVHGSHRLGWVSVTRCHDCGTELGIRHHPGMPAGVPQPT